MITILTTMPKQEVVTPDYRRDMAAAIARFMPDYHHHKNSVPYPVYESGDGAYVIDGGNNWWCQVDDENSQRITISYRHASEKPGVEFALAQWIISCRHGWEIEPALHAAGRCWRYRMSTGSGDPVWRDILWPELCAKRRFIHKGQAGMTGESFMNELAAVVRPWLPH